MVVAGALVAGLLLPVVGGSGLLVRDAASSTVELPPALTEPTPDAPTRVLAADGSLITEFYAKDRVPVTSDRIAPVMEQALVDIEDSRFYEHGGVDVRGTARALATDVAAGGVAEGGSTLTQQLVKQTLLQTATTDAGREAAVEQDGVAGISRKVEEARLAIEMEQHYSKDEILTRYLNTVYFGEGAYGIQAAAQRFFSVDAADLDLAQASVLAGLVQSPTDDDPITHPDQAATRRNEVLQRMHDLGHISDQDLASTTAAPVTVVEGAAPPRGCTAASTAPFFCDYEQSYLLGTLGMTQDQLDTGGYTVQTTLQPDLQASTDRGLTANIPMGSRFVGALDVVQPGTGHVLAMSVNRRFGCTGDGCTSVDYGVVPQAGAGSTYKAFTAAAALSRGFGAHYTITAPQPYTSTVFKGYDAKGHYGPYVVHNDDAGYAPTYDMTSALVASTNTYFVALEDALGSIDGPLETSVAMGMHYDDAVTQHPVATLEADQSGSFTLGAEATSPLDLADAYATIAASGTQCDPTPVTAVLDGSGRPAVGADGTPLATGDTCHPGALSPSVADTLANMLTGVVGPGGTGRKAAVPGRQVAGKTGTTQGNKTAAFAGITPDYSVGVMYFDPDPANPHAVGGVGGGVPAQVFHDAMARVIEAGPVHDFPPADPAVETGTKGHGPGYQAPAPAAPAAPAAQQPASTPSD